MLYRLNVFFLQNLHHSEDLRLIDFDANQIKCFENIFGLALLLILRITVGIV
jgi:hypothetical protein